MRWIIPAAGVLVLFLLAWGTRRRTALPYRDAPLESELTTHLEGLADRPAHGRRVRLRPSRGLPGRLERRIGFLSRLPAEELLPAARWLSDHGRFLQEEAASLALGLTNGPRLPAGGNGEARIALFAREYLSHANGDLRPPKLGEALAAWQKQSPFTVPELNALPLALRLALLCIADEMAGLCRDEQRACMLAARTAAELLRGKEKRAMRLFARHSESAAYLERLSGELRKAGDGAPSLWLERYFHQHGLSAEKLMETERRRQTDDCLWARNAILSLHTASRMPWDRLLEEWSPVHAALCRDETYPAMDLESRAYYRETVTRLSRQSGRPELSVCAAAFALCQAAPEDTVRAHVGYYLLDEGRAALLDSLRPSRLGIRKPGADEKRGLGLFRLGSWAAFAALLALAWFVRIHPAFWLPFGIAFLHAGQQAVYWLCRRWLKPRMTPRLRVDALGEALQTLVVCPTLLLDGAHALSMVKQLSILHHANPDPNLHFLLLGDYRDSLTGTLSGDGEIVSTAAAAVRALREDTGHEFNYIQRERTYHPADHLHMSRERKRGSLETLLRLIEGQPIAESFAYCSLPPESLKGRYRYVITLDSDTFLPPGAALRMVGAMLHPLQCRREAEGKLRGISVLQPRMETAAHRVTGWLGLLLGGQGGADPYNTLAADFYHDLCGRGSFVGKGIIDPAAFLAATEGKILPGSVLSHDLLEGELAGCKTASDIVLYDGHPDTLKGFLLRLHRWTRGDWQLLPYVLPAWLSRQPAAADALDGVGKHKVRMGLFRSLAEPMRFLLLLYAAATDGWGLFLAALLLCELPYLSPLTGISLASFAARLAALPLYACVQADAMGRTLYRLFVSRRNLLQWVTAAQTSLPSDKPPMLFFSLSMLSAGLLAALSLWPRGIFVPGLTLAVWWTALPFLLPYLEKTYGREQRPTEFMDEALRRLAAGTMLYFETAVTEDDHGLPGDNVQIDPNKGVSHRTSPTNIGLYLTALLAAEKLRLLPGDEAVRRVERAVDTVEKLPKWNGHLYNWYDTRTLEPLRPLYVSTVDSGNCAVSLLACAQGLRVLLPRLPEPYRTLPARLDRLAESMDFRPLFDWDAELFRIGVHPEAEEQDAARYDLLASEARMTSFVGIMLGQIPVRHWYRLGRAVTRTRRGQTLLSYSGTMFEYMMPLLFLPTVRGTLMERALRGAFREQAAHRLRGLFGVSESGYHAFDPNLYYQYRAFGIPSLALDPDVRADVIAPYASVLSLPVDLKRSFLNLLRLQSLGLEGPMGFFEAADFSASPAGRGRAFQVVRSHMTHHQGMILITICNILNEQYIARLFSDLPRARAHCLLLEERQGRMRGAVRRPLKRTLAPALPAPLYAERAARPLAFPVDAHLLHGAGVTVLIDAQGGGYMARNGLLLTRFRESCALPSGMRVFLRDSRSGSYWSATDPNLNGSASFETAQAVFRHERLHVAAELRIFVNPLDGAALHCVTLENAGPMERMMEICSYLEPALCPGKDDAAHPAYQNLFIRTERLDRFCVAAVHRPREPERAPVRLWHMLSSDVPVNVLHMQTDRSAFIGRGRSIYAPRGLEQPISGMADRVGDMIEPCLSLRAQFILPAKGEARLVFATLCPGERDTVAGFLERYDRPENALRCFEMASTQGEVTARTLGLTTGEQNAVSRLTGALCYTGQPFQFRYTARNALPLRELWSLGLSGDLPILLLECGDADNLGLAELLLKAHAWYRMSGLWIDLVLLASQPSGYDRPLQAALSRLAQKSHSHELIGKDGGVRLLERESLTGEQAELLRAAARLRLSASDGSLEDQLNALLVSSRPRPAYTCKPSVQWKMALPPGEELLYDNGFGGFSPADGRYVITLPPGRQTPAPWCHPLCSPGFGTLAGESGLVFTYAGNSHTGRLTRWPNDAVSPGGDENFYLRDDGKKLLWSVTRYPLGYGLPCRISYSPGEAVYESSGYGIYARLHCFTDDRAQLGVRVLHLKNEDEGERVLAFFHVCTFDPPPAPGGAQLCALERIDGGLLLENPELGGVAGLFGVDPEPALSTAMSAGAFQGLWGVTPAALTGAEPLPSDGGNTALLCFTVQLKPGESKTVVSVLGRAVSRRRLERALAALRNDGASLRLRAVRQSWEQRLSGLRFDLPDPALTLMLNRWLPYQVLASRLMMRAGFYQAGGAYGFRDQLQDMLPLVYTMPDKVREHLLLCAAHQYEEGDVQHWWHPERWGVRTRISDDRLFLPFVTAVYVRVTGDGAVLDEECPYLRSPLLKEGEEQRLETPEVSPLREPLWRHCVRAIDRVELGARGLPLMGGGDWNDGMNQVGGENGESVWLGMFLCEVLRRFIPLCEPPLAVRYGELRQRLLDSLDRHAWDGAWYLRGWYDQGDKLGSVSSAECRIDLLPQCWAVLAGLNRERCGFAMDSVWRMLYDRELGLLRLLTPPFDGGEQPGYIAGYLPGVRENGGQYIHALPWAAAAYHQLGQEEKAWELMLRALPVRRAATRQLAVRYRVEPYALAGDVYLNPQQRGRGGWTWYTGSAAWYLYVLLEQLLGFQKEGDALRFRPVLPAGWESVSLTYRYGSATYRLHGLRDCPWPMADGQRLPEGTLHLVDDGRIHEGVFPAR